MVNSTSWYHGRYHWYVYVPQLVLTIIIFWYNVMSQLSDWKRGTHVCALRTKGGYTYVQMYQWYHYGTRVYMCTTWYTCTYSSTIGNIHMVHRVHVYQMVEYVAYTCMYVRAMVAIAILP